MSFTTSQPMRRCGRRWNTAEDAEHSKLYLTGDYQMAECPCGGWHLTPKAKSAPRAKAAAPRDTGPDRATRAAVLRRDGFACARCGKPCGPGIAAYSLQHRKARGVGGDSSAPNLLLLCGTATSPDCHAAVESRCCPDDQAKGYRLESWQDPAAEAVVYFEHPDGGGFTA